MMAGRDLAAVCSAVPRFLLDHHPTKVPDAHNRSVSPSPSAGAVHHE